MAPRLAQRAAIVDLYDERFCRMWEAYRCMSEAAFRYLGQMVFQIQLTRRVDALPITLLIHSGPDRPSRLRLPAGPAV